MTDQPLYDDDMKIPERFRDTPFEDLPPAIQRKILRATGIQETIEES